MDYLFGLLVSAIGLVVLLSVAAFLLTILVIAPLCRLYWAIFPHKYPGSTEEHQATRQ